MTSIGALIAAMLLSTDARLAARMSRADQTDRAEQRSHAEKTDVPRCWEGSEEVKNADGRSRKAPPLPERFEGSKVSRTAIVLMLCIDSDGQVARTLVQASSGNADVDDFYRSTLSKWTFEPAVENGEPVPSVFTVAVNWNPR